MFFWTADSFRNSADFTSAPCQQRDDLRPLPGNMFHVQENNAARLTISFRRPSWKGSFRRTRVPSLLRVCTFSSLPASNLSGEDEQETERRRGQHAGPPAQTLLCVCVWLPLSLFLSLAFFFFFGPFYYEKLAPCLSISLFPANQVLPTCQPRRDARSFKNTAN